MRVPDSLSYQNAINNMNDAKAKLDKLSTIASTTKNFQYSSDDPSTVSSAMILRSSVSKSESYISSSEITQEWMDSTETAYGLMNDLISEANTLMLAGLSDTVSADERVNDYAVQIEGILEQAVAIANTSYDDKYLFSGYQLNTKPFSIVTTDTTDPDTGETTTVTTVEYAGDDGQMTRELSPGVTVTLNSDGEASFNDFFNALILAKEGLETDDSTKMNTALANLTTALNTMNQNRTNNAALLKQVETNIEHLETTQLELKSLLSIKEDANMTEAVTLLELQTTTYETVLEVGSRAISALNLFDVLG